MIKVGDKVEIIDKLDRAPLKGWKGRIIHLGDREVVGVEFENKIPNLEGHNCDGRGKEGHCRYGFLHEIKLLPEDWDD